MKRFLTFIATLIGLAVVMVLIGVLANALPSWILLPAFFLLLGTMAWQLSDNF